jgi:CRP-like cAMP-binding protein
MNSTDSHYLGGYEVTQSGDWVRLGGSDREVPLPLMAPTFWDGLTDPARHWFLVNGLERRVVNGHRLLTQGARPTKVIILLDGTAVSETVTECGERGYTGLARSGDLIGATEAISAEPYPATVRAIAPHNRVLAVALQVFHQALDDHPEITRALVHALTKQLTHAERRRSILLGPARRRIARILLYLAEQVGAPSPAGSVITITQADLALWTGLSIRSVEETIRGFQERDGCIAHTRRKITITDMECLRLYARGG